MPHITRDTFLSGRLKVSQPQNGYRFSIDAALLAAKIHPKTGERILDLGTGCGIIPLILATRWPGVFIHAVEVQPALAELADKNVTDNHMTDRIVVYNADMRDLPTDKIKPPYQWVCSNPPYYRVHSGRTNPNSQKAIARHELKIDLEQLMAAAGRMLGKGGRFVMIYAAERTADLVAAMRSAAIEPKLLQGIHGRSEEPARLVLVEGVRGGRPGLHMPAPIVVYSRDGRYTEVVASMLTV